MNGGKQSKKIVYSWNLWNEDNQTNCYLRNAQLDWKRHLPNSRWTNSISGAKSGVVVTLIAQMIQPKNISCRWYSSVFFLRQPTGHWFSCQMGVCHWSSSVAKNDEDQRQPMFFGCIIWATVTIYVLYMWQWVRRNFQCDCFTHNHGLAFNPMSVLLQHTWCDWWERTVT